MAENTKRFDPRFDPAFQPGYQATDAVKTPVGRPALPVQQPTYRIGERVAPRPEVEQLPAAPADAARVDETEEAEPEEAEGRRNPFLIALWIAGPAAVVLGVAGSYWQYGLYGSTGFGPTDDVTLALANLMGALAGPLVTTGLGCLAAALVISAVRWKR